MRAFISGVTGFVGGRLAQRLVSCGIHVNGLARDPTKTALLTANGFEAFSGDVAVAETLVPAMAGCDIAFHCAAVGGGTLQESRQTNVAGTASVLNCASRSGVRRVVHLSSVVVYGDDLPAVVDESCPYLTRGSSYALSKAEGEQVALSLGGELGVEVSVLQPTCVYGPGSPVWTMRFFQRVRDEQTVLVDDGAGMCNLVHIDDLIDAALLAADCDGAAGERFIISGPTPATWRAYLNYFAQMCGKPAPPSVPLWKARLQSAVMIWHFRFTRRPMKFDWSDVQLMRTRAVFSIAKARAGLGYRPKVDIDAGMADTAAWLHEQGYLTGDADWT